MQFGIQIVSAVVLATYQFLIVSFLHLGITLIINLVIRRATIQNVMFASTLFQQILLVLLNIGHIHFGSKNTALPMNMIILLDAAAVREWSQGTRGMSPLMMVENSA